MKHKHRIPLRLRLTLLTALTLTIACVLLTLSSLATYHNFTVEPGKPPVEVSGTGSSFTKASIIFMFIIISAGTIASWFIAGKALKPVSSLSRQIENIDESRLFEPLTGFDGRDEVGRLAAFFNNLISKLKKAFIRQKLFAANAAHELKTPLASIITNIEVLKMDEEPTVQDYKEVMETVLISARRLSDLVSDLLKMNNTPDTDSCVIFDAYGMFDYIIASLSKSAEGKGIRIINKTSGTVLFGERTLLIRAFFNLIENAVKYNKPNGEVVISASCSGKETKVIIRDTGIGIPKGEIENIFEPFYRVDTSRSRELGGSGLGLSIAKAIIEKHRGNIFAESESGDFTKIIVVLPLN